MSLTPTAAESAAGDVIDAARLVVCVGSGGVGKTTTSAALALRAAARGRRVLVLTIDPARRLANAMGLELLDNEPREVDLRVIGGRGTLHAAMLDAVASFDELIRETAPTEEDAERILNNRIYRMMVDHFAGVQEYMAVVRLFDVYEAGRWDQIVLDTPPSKNASDFFGSSKRASAMFDERIIRWFLPNADASGGLLQRVFNPGAVVLKLLGVIGGEAFVGELSEFFEAMNTIREDLQRRGDRVDAILKDETTRYVVVASPDPRRVDEAVDFHARLRAQRQEVALYVLNRSHDRFVEADLAPLEAAAEQRADDDALAGTVARVGAFYHSLLALSARDRAAVQSLMQRVASDRVRTVPAFSEPIHTLGQLLRLSAHVVG